MTPIEDGAQRFGGGGIEPGSLAARVAQRQREALDAADKLADAVIHWHSHVTLEQLAGEYRAARHRAGARS